MPLPRGKFFHSNDLGYELFHIPDTYIHTRTSQSAYSEVYEEYMVSSNYIALLDIPHREGRASYSYELFMFLLNSNFIIIITFWKPTQYSCDDYYDEYRWEIEIRLNPLVFQHVH